jgi:hypothetical protein
VARNSIVGAATRHSLDGMGLRPSEGEIFGTRSDCPGVHLASCTVQWVPGLFPGGLEVEIRDNVDHPVPPNKEIKERVQLYLYFILRRLDLF